jgi:hypothetical protein
MGEKFNKLDKTTTSGKNNLDAASTVMGYVADLSEMDF